MSQYSETVSLMYGQATQAHNLGKGGEQYRHDYYLSLKKNLSTEIQLLYITSHLLKIFLPSFNTLAFQACQLLMFP